MILNYLGELYDEWAHHILALLFILFGVLTVVLMIFGIVYGASHYDADAIARCKSLNGEYGQSKCFKNGKEV